MTQQEKIEKLAALILEQTRERLARMYTQGQADAEHVEIIPRKLYTLIDRGTKWNGHVGQGFLMIEHATGHVYGIKAYGKVHKGHCYGTLDTVDAWYWGDFYPRKR